jgi:HPt (histidine-containing phosphotransfer) domain-containing protein
MAIDMDTLDRLRDIVGGDEADLKELIESFLEEAPGLLESLLASREGPDMVTMRRSAHSLKSNARDMGALAVADLCARIEHSSAAGTVPDAAVFEDVKQQANAAFEELRRYIGMGD